MLLTLLSLCWGTFPPGHFVKKGLQFVDRIKVFPFYASRADIGGVLSASQICLNGVCLANQWAIICNYCPASSQSMGWESLLKKNKLFLDSFWEVYEGPPGI